MNHAEFAEIIKQDANLSSIFVNWCNMLWRWSARGLHGIHDVTTVERCVGFTMCSLAEIEEEIGSPVTPYINPLRPISYGYLAKDTFVPMEMVVRLATDSVN